MSEELSSSEKRTQWKAPETGIHKLPGGSIAESQLWEPRVLQYDGKLIEQGVKTPRGEYFHFNAGERFALVREDNDRKPVIILPDGQDVSFQAWKTLRTEQNRKIFEEADPDYSRAYLQVLNEYPELEVLNVKAGTQEQYPMLQYTGGFWQRPTESDPSPSIVVKMGGEQHYDRLMVDRETSARQAAEMLGITFEKLKASPNILKLFIFLHEIGHAQDYITNYFNDPKSESDPEYNPAAENRAQRDREMATLPIPNTNPVQARQYLDRGILGPHFERNKTYFEKLDISTVEDLLTTHEKAYRELPSERYADTFAANVLRKNWGRLKLDQPLDEAAPAIATVERANEEALPDAVKLKAIYEKCTRKYEGRHPSALFGINIEIEESELSELDKLVSQAESVVNQFKAQIPQWEKFNQLLEERRRKVGSIGEEKSIIEDPQATDATKDLIEGSIPAIRVPSYVRHIYLWENMTRSVKEDVEDYRGGRAKARSAVRFGQNIKQLYRFLKESRNQ